MEQIDLQEVAHFVNKNVVKFHQSKLKRLESIDLKSLLKKKNPYLFRAKNITVATDLITGILDAFLSSSEEKLFGDFLEQLAIFIAGKACNGRKSAATGIDLEFENESVYHLVSVKSGPNWGNSQQHKKQETDFNTAVKVLKQLEKGLNVQPVLGICYGKTKTTIVRNHIKVVGQSFWYLISGNKHLYTEIIEPLGYKAKQHNDSFNKKKSKVINIFTDHFLKDFCIDGEINWEELVRFNSGNMEEQ